MNLDNNLEICRACLCTTSLLSPIIPSQPNKTEHYKEMFLECTNLNVTENDGLPSLLCNDCIDELIACFTFRNKCIHSDKELRCLENRIDNNTNSIFENLNYSTSSDDANNSSLAIFPCRKCFKYFLTYGDLLKHNSEHPIQDCMNSCCYCGTKHSTMRQLVQHIETDHFENHQIECGYCNFECTTESHMVNHITDAHQDNTGVDFLIDILSETVTKTFTDQNLKDFLKLNTTNVKTLTENENEVCVNNTLKNYNFENDSIIEEHVLIPESIITYDSEEVFEKNSLIDNNTMKNVEIIGETVSISLNIGTETFSQEQLDLEDERQTDDSTYEEIKEVQTDDSINDEDLALETDYSDHLLKDENLCLEKKELSDKEEKDNKDPSLHVCSVCNDNFTTLAKLQRHVITHNPDKPFRCKVPKCKCSFASDESLQTHILVYHNNVDGKNQCIYCDKSYAKPKHLRAHMITHRREKKFKCKYCPKSFHLSHHWKNHEYIHVNKKTYLCADCGKRFLTKDRLGLHQRIHTSVRPYGCDLCDKKFLTNFQLTTHRVSHSNERPFLCSDCGKSFKLEVLLKSHIRNSQCMLEKSERKAKLSLKKKLNKKQEETYCSLCCSNFNTTRELTQHMKIHSYQYCCKLCLKPFAILSKLEQHIKYHKEIKQNHSCHLCNASYTRADRLKYHILRKHSEDRPFMCLLCDKGFIQSGDLKIHMRRHAGDRPYSCDVCLKSFVTSTTLNNHKKAVHSGERPYICNMCDKPFSSSAGLSMHARTHNRASNKNNGINT